mmetsp:Transcript_11704/g.49072  ORF Transcript_11704/g.49072 Transcript_11704/m.49072 type:complete len:255 (+) Transcript_11704:2273-3037(+)
MAHLNLAISKRKEMAGLRRLGRTSASAFSIASKTSDSASRSAERSASETALLFRIAFGNSRVVETRDSDSSARPAFRRHVARLCLASGAATTAADARSSASTRLRLVLARRRAAAIAGGGGSSTSCAKNTLPTTSTSAANCSAVSSASISGDFSANSVKAEGGGFRVSGFVSSASFGSVSIFGGSLVTNARSIEHGSKTRRSRYPLVFASRSLRSLVLEFVSDVSSDSTNADSSSHCTPAYTSTSVGATCACAF